MARLWGSGFEINSVTSNVEFRDVTGSPTISTTTVRSGTYAGRISSLSSSTPKLFTNWIGSGGDDTGPFFVRFYFRYATAPSADNVIFAMRNISTGAFIINVVLTSAGALKLKNEATQIGSTSSALSSNTWYRIEVKFSSAGGAGASEGTARIDGTNFASSTTETFSGGIGYLDFGGNIAFEAQTQGDWFFDDIAVNDSTGSAQTSYPGSGKIVHLKPDGAGDNNVWLHDDGSAADTNNYTEVDEVTPDDATSYVKRTTTGTITDDYNIESSSTGGIASTDTVTLVAIFVRAGATSATSTNRSGNVRIKSAASGTVSTSPNLDWSVNGWLTTQDTGLSSLHYAHVSYTDPTTGVAWTPTGTNSLDNAQIGIINTTSSTNEIRVSTIHLVVEYVPGAATSIKDIISSPGVIPFPR